MTVSDIALSLIEQNPANICPPEIFDRLVSVEVRFYTFEKGESGGFIVVDRELEEDVSKLFEIMHFVQFPITSVIPISQFGWDDERSMLANNTSGFNYRTIAGMDRLSLHAYGRAIDINPRINPCKKGDVVSPPGGEYIRTRRGTFTPDSFVVRFLKRRGFIWGGDWKDPFDPQHFAKPFTQ